jgi:hypothetical protein
MWKYVKLNITQPTVGGLMQIDKQNTLVRLSVNWQNTPAYKLDKHGARWYRNTAPFPYSFNMKNTIELIHNLREDPLEKAVHFVWLDMGNL